MLNKIKNLVKEEQGQGMTEYGLLLAVIVVIVVAALTLLKGSLTGLFQDVQEKLNGAVNEVK
jgi:pilus assembly protein Flp/PilA